MNIIITGGTGFIGSNLCRKLLAEGNTVICIDNNYTGCMGNIEQCLQNKNFTFIDHDVTLPILGDFVRLDQIYHLACPASPRAYQSDPLLTLNTCVIGTINILELAKKYNAKILLSSTSEVYGDPTISPQNEAYWGNVNPIGIRSCYDEGKRVAETYAMEYKNKYGVQIKIVRIFNTYGPRMDKNDGRVVSNFINQCMNGAPITIYGDGSQTRSLCYIDDLLDGFDKMMNSDVVGPINLGNPCEMTISEIATKIKKIIGSNSTFVFEELPKDDPMQRKPDISKANELLGWSPTINFNSGIELTADYFASSKI